jgi:predicted MFS family arabinose efflux permease
VNTGVQAKVDDEFRGRVMSIYLSSLLLGVPLGALIQGKLAAVVGLREVVVGSGLLWLGYLLWTVIRFHHLAPLDEQRVTTA